MEALSACRAPIRLLLMPAISCMHPALCGRSMVPVCRAMSTACANVSTTALRTLSPVCTGRAGFRSASQGFRLDRAPWERVNAVWAALPCACRGVNASVGGLFGALAASVNAVPPCEFCDSGLRIRYHAYIAPEQAGDIAVAVPVGPFTRACDAMSFGWRVLSLAVIFAPVAFTAPFAYTSPSARKWWCDLIASCFAAAGPVFVKLGQWMSTRPDMFAPDISASLSRLHSHACVHEFDSTVDTIEAAYGVPISRVFSHIEADPVGSGAVAQVHRAVLRATGEVVVVKVLHPGVEHAVRRDMALVVWAAGGIAQCDASVRWTSVEDGVREFSRVLTEQLDLRQEGCSLHRFRSNFGISPRSTVYFPRPIMPLVTHDVLVESYEPGTPILDFCGNASPSELSDVARRGATAFWAMVFRDQFIHGDMHPGNVLVRRSPRHWVSACVLRIAREAGRVVWGDRSPLKGWTDADCDTFLQAVILDGGIVISLSRRDRESLRGLLAALLQGNGRAGAACMIDNATACECTDRDAFLAEMGSVLDGLSAQLRQGVSAIRFGETLGHVADVVRKHRVKLEGNFGPLLMSAVVLEGLGRRLDPTLDVLTLARPYVVRVGLTGVWETIKEAADKTRIALRDMLQ